MTNLNKKKSTLSEKEINDRKFFVYQCMSNIGGGVINEATRCVINDYIDGTLSDVAFREAVLKILAEERSI